MNACGMVSGQWNSQIGVDNAMARQVTLTWSADNRLQATSYVVQFREQFTTQAFNTSPPVSVHMHICLRIVVTSCVGECTHARNHACGLLLIIVSVYFSRTRY